MTTKQPKSQLSKERAAHEATKRHLGEALSRLGTLTDQLKLVENAAGWTQGDEPLWCFLLKLRDRANEAEELHENKNSKKGSLRSR